MAGDLEFMILFMCFLFAAFIFVSVLWLIIMLLLKISDMGNAVLWRIKEWITKKQSKE